MMKIKYNQLVRLFSNHNTWHNRWRREWVGGIRNTVHQQILLWYLLYVHFCMTEFCSDRVINRHSFVMTQFKCCYSYFSTQHHHHRIEWMKLTMARSASVHQRKLHPTYLDRNKFGSDWDAPEADRRCSMRQNRTGVTKCRPHYKFIQKVILVVRVCVVLISNICMIFHHSQ